MRARTLTASAALATLLAVAACDGPILFAELEMPSVVVTLPQYTFPGDPTGLLSERDVSFDVGASVPVIEEPDVELEFRLTRMTLVLGTGGPISNFDGIQTVTLTALHPTDPALDLVLLQYEKPAGATGVTRISAGSETDADLLPFLTGGVINIRAAYEADADPTTSFPASDWTADLTAEFRFQITMDYGAYL
jgi:hypothetical protein